MSPKTHADARPTEPLSPFRPSISSRTFVTRYGESLKTSPLILDPTPSADSAQLTRNQPAAPRAWLWAALVAGRTVRSASATAIHVRTPAVPMPGQPSNTAAKRKTRVSHPRRARFANLLEWPRRAMKQTAREADLTRGPSVSRTVIAARAANLLAGANPIARERWRHRRPNPTDRPSAPWPLDAFSSWVLVADAARHLRLKPRAAGEA